MKKKYFMIHSGTNRTVCFVLVTEWTMTVAFIYITLLKVDKLSDKKIKKR